MSNSLVFGFADLMREAYGIQIEEVIRINTAIEIEEDFQKERLIRIGEDIRIGENIRNDYSIQIKSGTDNV